MLTGGYRYGRERRAEDEGEEGGRCEIVRRMWGEGVFTVNICDEGVYRLLLLCCGRGFIFFFWFRVRRLCF